MGVEYRNTARAARVALGVSRVTTALFKTARIRSGVLQPSAEGGAIYRSKVRYCKATIGGRTSTVGHRVMSAMSGPQKPTTPDYAPAPVHAVGAAESVPVRPLTHGLFTLPDEEETVTRAVPEQILALSRTLDPETKTIAVPRELLELSRREGEALPRAIHGRRAESELPVWDAWYGSDPSQMDSEEPVFDLRPSPRSSRSANAWSPQPLSPHGLSADDALALQALAPARHLAARAVVLMLAALGVAATYWSIQ
jgi:hypothetical protein